MGAMTAKKRANHYLEVRGPQRRTGQVSSLVKAGPSAQGGHPHVIICTVLEAAIRGSGGLVLRGRGWYER